MQANFRAALSKMTSYVGEEKTPGSGEFNSGYCIDSDVVDVATRVAMVSLFFACE